MKRYAVVAVVGALLMLLPICFGQSNGTFNPRAVQTLQTTPSDSTATPAARADGKPQGWEKWAPANKLAWLERDHTRLTLENRKMKEKLPADTVAAIVKDTENELKHSTLPPAPNVPTVAASAPATMPKKGN